MADKKTEEKKEEAGGKKKGPPMMIIMAVFAVVVLGAAFFMVQKASAKQKTTEVKKVEKGPVLSLDEFLVNLADPGSDHFLKVTVGLELDKAKGKAPEALKEDTPLIRDAVLSSLASKTRDQLAVEAGAREAEGGDQEEGQRRLGRRGRAGRLLHEFRDAVMKPPRPQFWGSMRGVQRRLPSVSGSPRIGGGGHNKLVNFARATWNNRHRRRQASGVYF